MNILIVDDDAVDRITVAELLGSQYSVLQASSRKEMLANMGSHPVDCILLDYLIPGTDSLSLLRDITATGLPVIMLTGEGNEELAVNAMKEGAQDYLIKRNLTTSLLQQRISSAIETVDLRRKLVEQQKQLVVANQSLNQKVNELERLNADLEDIIHITAHDLREPVGTVCTYCDLLEEQIGGQLPDEAQDLLEAIRRHSGRLASLVDDLRKLSRVAYVKLEQQSVSLTEVVSELLQNEAQAIRERRAQVEVEDLPTLDITRELVTELYRNLLGNALKYGARDNLKIVFTANRSNDNCILGVKNTGPRIPEDDKDKIFQPFYRSSPDPEIAGTGMGLTLCRKIVERHQGEIWLDSTYTDGVSVKFTLCPSASSS